MLCEPCCEQCLCKGNSVGWQRTAVVAFPWKCLEEMPSGVIAEHEQVLLSVLPFMHVYMCTYYTCFILPLEMYYRGSVAWLSLQNLVPADSALKCAPLAVAL